MQTMITGNQKSHCILARAAYAFTSEEMGGFPTCFMESSELKLPNSCEESSLTALTA